MLHEELIVIAKAFVTSIRNCLVAWKEKDLQKVADEAKVAGQVGWCAQKNINSNYQCVVNMQTFANSIWEQTGFDKPQQVSKSIKGFHTRS